MPFDIAPRKLTVGDKLAAAIEIGRAANPGAKQIRHSLVATDAMDTKAKYGCAMAFAMWGAGVEPGRHHAPVELATALEVNYDELMALANRVVEANDTYGLSLDEIVKDLRAGTLPEEHHRVNFDITIKAIPTIGVVESVKYFYTNAQYLEISPWPVHCAEEWTSEPPKPAKAAVRKSSKTGATWPKPKHAYA